MTYDELNALYQQGQTGETFYDEQGNPYTFNDVRLPDGGVLSRRGDGSYRVETYNDGRGRGGGYDIYADGRQEPFGFDKTQSTGERLLSVFGPVAAVASAGALAPYLTGAGAAGAAGGTGIGTAGAGGATLSELIAAQGLPALAGVEPIAATAASFGAPAAAGTAAASALSNGMWDVLPEAVSPGASNGSWDFLPPASAPRAPTDGGFDLGKLLSNPALLAGAAGAVAGVAGNSDITSSQTGTTSGATNATQSSSGSQGLAPWLQGYAQDYVGRAQSLANAPSSNAAMDAGRGLLANAAMQGDPLVNAARGQQQNLIGGGMLNANPYIGQVAQNIGDRMGDAYARGTAANTDATFARAKAFGGSAWDEQQRANQQAFGDSLGNTMSNLYYGNYQGERAAQDAASRGSLGFGQFGANAANNLYNVGAQDFQRPFAQNAQYGAAIQPAFGSQTANTANTTGQTNANTTQNSTMQAPNNFLAGAGGAMNALALYRMYTGGR